MSDNREVTYKSVNTDVRMEYEGDDPMTVFAVFSHLREILGMPDIGHVEVSLTIDFERLSDEQIAVLETLGSKGWGLSRPQVLARSEHTRYSDGSASLRRLSPDGKLLEPPESWDSEGKEIADPSAN